MRLHRVPELTAQRAIRDADAVYTTISESDPIDLGEHWPALHYTLCGESPMPRYVALARGVEWDDDSLENVLMGGEATPYEDGLCVARVLAPRTVKVLAAQLNALTPEKVWDQVDDGIDEFLPADWPSATKRAAVVAPFMRLVECFAAAANAGEAILLYVP
jgi:hypothetical protein